MDNFPLVSIITVVFNNKNSIQNAIDSVSSQDYPNIEYIVIDGGSNDGTVNIINSNLHNISIFKSKPDNGVYDALNKGLRYASGEIIGVLHSDDKYTSSKVISSSVNQMIETKSEIVFSDVVIINPHSKKILRYYRANYFREWLLNVGWMPPHPSCFVSKSLFDYTNGYSTDFKIASDFDFFVKIFHEREVKWTYLNQLSVIMMQGGLSNSGYKSAIMIIKEVRQSLRSNKIWAPYIFQTVRYLIRFFEMIIRPSKDKLL
jgi:glycosyltransferase involved in cell wall biosynthesis